MGIPEVNMKLDDMMLTVVTQLLAMPDGDFPQAVSNFMSLTEGFDFDHPKAPRKFSVAGTREDGQLLGLWAWLKELRAAGFRHGRMEAFDTSGPLPPRIAAAFQNGGRRLLRVSSPTRSLFYVLSQVTARSTALSGEDLILLFDNQFSEARERDALWRELLEKDISRFQGYFEATSLEDARRFLAEDYERLHCPAEDLLKTAQYYCARKGVAFQIPESLHGKLQRWPALGGDLDLFDDSPYLKEPLTAAEFASWIDAQAGRGDIWLKIRDEMRWLANGDEALLSRFTYSLSAEATRSAFLNLTVDELAQLPSGNFTQHLGRDPVVPSSIADKIEFPKRPPVDRAELWHAVDNPDFWQMIVFQFAHEESGTATSIGASSAEPWEALVPPFADALKAAKAFARRVQSGFYEAFALARWVLVSDSVQWNRPDAQSTALTQMKESGFSARAEDAIHRSSLPRLAAALNFSEKKARVLMALEIADVFGGMMSWNDQAFESEADSVEYERVSNELFDAFMALKVAVS